MIISSSWMWTWSRYYFFFNIVWALFTKLLRVLSIKWVKASCAVYFNTFGFMNMQIQVADMTHIRFGGEDVKRCFRRSSAIVWDINIYMIFFFFSSRGRGNAAIIYHLWKAGFISAENTCYTCSMIFGSPTEEFLFNGIHVIILHFFVHVWNTRIKQSCFYAQHTYEYIETIKDRHLSTCWLLRRLSQSINRNTQAVLKMLLFAGQIVSDSLSLFHSPSLSSLKL